MYYSSWFSLILVKTLVAVLTHLFCVPMKISAYQHFCLSLFLQHANQTSDFLFTFWLIFWQFSFKVFPKFSVQKNKNRTPKVCSKLKTKQNAVKPFPKSQPKSKNVPTIKNHLPKAKNETERS